jgi:hypothetical protein
MARPARRTFAQRHGSLITVSLADCEASRRAIGGLPVSTSISGSCNHDNNYEPGIDVFTSIALAVILKGESK